MIYNKISNAKILIDMTHIHKNSIFSSLAIYVYRILDNVPQEQKQIFTLLITKDLENFIQTKYPDFKYIFFNDSELPKWKPLKILEQTKRYKHAVNESKCNILFIASDLHPYTCVKVKPAKVVVIHDLKVLKIKTVSPIRGIIKILHFIFYSLFIKNANKVIAISNYTQNDILYYFKTPKTKITTIYNSVTLAKSSAKPQKIDNNLKYILYVNTLQEYKNIITLIKAYNLIKPTIQHKLVIVGKTTQYWENTIEPLIQQYHINDRIIHLQNLRDEELKYLYENASVFITTSLREGFGYTPIEASLCACPVISTLCEALPDTTMNLLHYYTPPQDSIALSKKIIEILNNTPDKQEMQKIAETFALRYSTQHQIENLFQCFNEMTNK